MNLDILKIGIDPVLHFEAVARLQSLKHAARELNLSQPAVTHSLNKLEGNLKVQLCVRSRSQFALTEAGTRLFVTAREIKKSLRGFQSFLADSKDFDGLFSIGILSGIDNNLFADALTKTMKEFPRLKLSIQAYAGDSIQNLVAGGELDAGIGLFKRRDGLSYKAIGEETISHYISDNHPLWKQRRFGKEELKGRSLTWLDIINRSRPSLEVEIFADNKSESTSVRSYANSLRAAVYILQSGMSIVPFPCGYLESRHLPFKFRRLDDVFKPYVLKQSVVTRPDFASASVATKFFLEQIPQYKS